MIHAWRTEAYFVHRTDSDEPANAEAGSSSFVPQHITYMAQPPTNPSGESSEAMADDENPKTFTEEHAAPVSNFYCSHVPRVTEWVFGVGRQGPSQGQGSRSIRRLDIMGSSGSCAPGHKSGSTSLTLQHMKRLWIVSADPGFYSGESWSN